MSFKDLNQFKDELKGWIKDPIVSEVQADLQDRSDRGIQKYGTTLADNPAEVKEWLNHLYEELLDAALYIKRLNREI